MAYRRVCRTPADLCAIDSSGLELQLPPQRTTPLAPNRHIVAVEQQSLIAVPKRPRPLSGLDAGFLYLEAAGTPMHVGSVMLLEVPARQQAKFFDRLAAHLRERLPRAPALRRQLHAAPLGLGHPLWSELPELDLRQ